MAVELDRHKADVPIPRPSPLVYIKDARVAALSWYEEPGNEIRIERLADINNSLPKEERLNFVTVILDGNRRDATEHGKSVSEGHKIGAEKVLDLLPPFARLGIKNLGLWGASTGNFDRGPEEWQGICDAMEYACDEGLDKILKAGGKIIHRGRTDRITSTLRTKLQNAEDVTAQGRNFTIWVLADYSEEYEQERDRQSVIRATEAGLLKSEEHTWELDKFITENVRMVPKMQLVIRPGTQNKGKLVNFSDLGRASGDAYIHPIYETLGHTRISQYLNGVEDWLGTQKRARK